MQNIIKYKNVDIYQKDRIVLTELNFSIAKGEFVYLTGAIGSGKTSLFKSIYADLPIYKGEAIVTDFLLNQIKQKDIPYLRRKIGIVFQDFQLLAEKTIYENLEFVLNATGWNSQSARKARIMEVLELVDINGKEEVFPHQLSGGEQQSIVIARALLNKPDIILADEPTGNLDPVSSNRVMDILQNIQYQGTSVFMATHNYSIVEKYKHRILHLSDKRIKEVSI